MSCRSNSGPSLDPACFVAPVPTARQELCPTLTKAKREGLIAFVGNTSTVD